VPDPSFVDEVAVERACAGERVRLTPAEFVAAVARLRTAGFLPRGIAHRLRKGRHEIAAALSTLADREADATVLGGEAA
jgi:hypothetical protein